MPMETKTNIKQEHAASLNRATIVARNSLLIVIGLTILKAFGGYVTNIIPLVADAIGSFSDIIAGLAIFVGLKLSQKRANTNFKYGFHRVETFTSLCISIVILYAGGRIFWESVQRFMIPAETTEHTFGLIIAGISVAVSIFTFWYQKNIAHKIDSGALLASAYDKRNDAFISASVLVTVIADKFSIPFIEPAIGVLISIIILWTGVKYGKDSLLYLLDYWDNPQVTSQIESLLRKSKIVTNVKKIRLRRAGTYIFGEAFLEINPFTDSKDLRDEIHRLDKDVERNVEHLGDLVLYIDPPKPVTVRVAIPVSEDKGLSSRLANDPTKPFQFFFAELKNARIKKFYSIPETFTAEQTAEISNFLKRHNVNILITNIIKPVLYYNLRLNNIKIYPRFLDVDDVENTVKLLLLDI